MGYVHGRLTEDDGVSWEHSEVGMQLIEEVQLVCRAADGPGKEKDIALQPRDLGGRVLESDTWSWFRHGSGITPALIVTKSEVCRDCHWLEAGRSQEGKVSKVKQTEKKI